MGNRIAIAICSCFLLLKGLDAQRTTTSLSAAWEFSRTARDSVLKFDRVDLPHTYNREDPFDDQPGYYRGKATYRKILLTRDLDQNRRHFLHFGAVNQHASVYVNGTRAGEHYGGYTAFNIEITDFLSYGTDTLLVEVDNSHDPNVVPLRGDFTFYGGIYRGVTLISTSNVHFSTGFYGSLGTFIEPLSVTDELASLRAWGYAEYFDPAVNSIKVFLRDGSDITIDSAVTQAIDMSTGLWEVQLMIPSPRLWSLEDPHLYEVGFLLFEGDQAIDDIQVNYGVRYFSFDADKGFFLNGKHEKLIGVNRHQDMAHDGNAVGIKQMGMDLEYICDLGANFLRTAHYPQHPFILETCDQNGIAVTMEIPLDHEITDSPAFAENAKHMMLEMIYQYYNHPSIFIWAYMNEMGLGKQLQRDSLHMTKVASLARELEDLTRQADPHRYTMIPNHGYFEIYHKFGLTEIPMIVGWNLYYGWYEDDFEGFGRFVDHAHEMLPDKPMIITEYGAGADPRLTSFAPLRFDFTLDWTLKFHQANLRQILERPFIAGSAVWNMFDFGSEARQDAVPHINSKGLWTYDRNPKPVSYLYQAHLRTVDIAKIEALPDFVLLPDEGVKRVPVSVISNSGSVLLNTANLNYENSQLIVPKNYVAETTVAFGPGPNRLSADDLDSTTVIGYTRSNYWDSNNTLRINFGSNTYFKPDDRSLTWVPDAEMPSSFLKVKGGQIYSPRNRGIGTDRGIAGTTDDPVYQTMITGVESIEIPLPAGNYKVGLCIAQIAKEEYNCQDVEVQGRKIHICNLTPFSAEMSSLEISVTDTLRLTFSAQNNNTFINGLQIIRE